MAGGDGPVTGAANQAAGNERADPVTASAIDEIRKKRRQFTTSFTGGRGATGSVLLDIPKLGGGSGKSLLGQ